MINKWTSKEKKQVWKCTTEDFTKKINGKNGLKPLWLVYYQTDFDWTPYRINAKFIKKVNATLLIESNPTHQL